VCAALLSVSACVSATCVALAGLALTWQLLLPSRVRLVRSRRYTADGFSEHLCVEVRLTFLFCTRYHDKTPLRCVAIGC